MSQLQWYCDDATISGSTQFAIHELQLQAMVESKGCKPTVRCHGYSFGHSSLHFIGDQASGGAEVLWQEFAFESTPDVYGAAFDALAREWKQDCEFMSSAAMMSEHPAYREIVGMGMSAVPLILKELEADHDHWFIALHEITGEQPVPQESAGIVAEMCDAWLAWGKGKGYI